MPRVSFQILFRLPLILAIFSPYLHPLLRPQLNLLLTTRLMIPDHSINFADREWSGIETNNLSAKNCPYRCGCNYGIPLTLLESGFYPYFLMFLT